ncbi:cysteine hydrolase family protein [Roseovarius indicus]|uniref:cysteine hydrolase family protein n=1 Tax=Roseovarius indicus TaxID=540747 RepID=UPI0032EEE819
MLHSGELASSSQEVPTSERVRSAALVVVDMQNDFVRQGAPLEVPTSRATIPVISGLVDTFHARDLPVIFTRFVSGPEPGLMWLWSPECRPDTKCCWPGHLRSYDDAEGALDCAAVVDELRPEAGDIVIDKRGYGAFHGTDLSARLRYLNVSSLVVTGTVTQICVEETAREAFHHGFRTTMVSDGVSSYAPDLHAATLKNFALKFGWVAGAEEVASWL